MKFDFGCLKWFSKAARNFLKGYWQSDLEVILTGSTKLARISIMIEVCIKIPSLFDRNYLQITQVNGTKSVEEYSY